MEPSKELFRRIQAYLDSQLAHQELFKWLLEYAAFFLEEPEDAFEVQVWSRALNLLCLLNDSAIEERLVRHEIQSLLASRQVVVENI